MEPVVERQRVAERQRRRSGAAVAPVVVAAGPAMEPVAERQRAAERRRRSGAAVAPVVAAAGLAMEAVAEPRRAPPPGRPWSGPPAAGPVAAANALATAAPAPRRPAPGLATAQTQAGCGDVTLAMRPEIASGFTRFFRQRTGDGDGGGAMVRGFRPGRGQIPAGSIARGSRSLPAMFLPPRNWGHHTICSKSYAKPKGLCDQGFHKRPFT